MRFQRARLGFPFRTRVSRRTLRGRKAKSSDGVIEEETNGARPCARDGAKEIKTLEREPLGCEGRRTAAVEASGLGLALEKS